MIAMMMIAWLASTCVVDHYIITTFYFGSSGVIWGAAGYTVPGDITCVIEREPWPGTAVAWTEARAYDANQNLLPQECQPALPVSR